MTESLPPHPSAEHSQSASEAIDHARKALQIGDRRAVRRWAELAARLDPNLEDPWLFLAAVASPRASLEYLHKALEINPTSHRANKGISWILERLDGELQGQRSSTLAGTEKKSPKLVKSRVSASNSLSSKHAQSIVGSSNPRKSRKSTPFIVWYAFGTLIFALLFLSTALSPFFPQLMIDISKNIDPLMENSAGILVDFQAAIGVNNVSTTVFPQTTTAAVYQPPEAVENTQTATPYQPATSTPTTIPTPTPTETPLPTETVLPSPTPTSQPLTSPTPTIGPTSAAPSPQPTKKPKKNIAVAGPGVRPGKVTLNDRWVDVDISSQQAFAMEGSEVARSFVVSTGRWPTTTVTGIYKIYVKYRKANMSGADYFLPNVPYVMYFFKGYGLHGTYWHNNFGTPMSHGCVNLRPEDAAWLFDFASVGTIVSIHQ